MQFDPDSAESPEADPGFPRQVQPGPNEPPPRAVVYRSREARTCHDAALVLEAAGVAYELISAPPEVWVTTAFEDGTRARRELVAYLRENRAFDLEPAFEPVSDGRAAVLGSAALLCALFLLERKGVLGLDWWGHGLLDAEAVQHGEWWRTLTALSLHSDLSHLASNLVFGGLFLWLLAQLTGSGLAFLLTGVAGGFGNLLNAYTHPLPHRSIGASTAVFAALGLLVGIEFLRRSKGPKAALRRFAPPVLGLFLLGWLGTGGGEAGAGRVDVLAHALGFLAGLALSPPSVALIRRLDPSSARVQTGAALLGLLGLAAAWVLALA